MAAHYPEILKRYLDQERDQGIRFTDATTESASDICGSCQSASEAAKRPEPVGREERSVFGESVKPLEEVALRTWAHQKGLWVEENVFLTSVENRFIGAGAEQKVYLETDGATVLKVNKGRFHTTWLDYFNRLLIHAFLFPTTKYGTVGFTADEGDFAVITRQPYATLEVGATRESVARYLEQQKYCRLRNDDYYNQSIGVRLEDLHDENVFQDHEGNLLFIDPVIYFETADLKMGGELVFRFPFGK